MEQWQIAEAFSRHQFSAVYDHLDEAVSWELPGQQPIEGKVNVIATCEETLASLLDISTYFDSFRVVRGIGDDGVVVDTRARYVAQDSSTAEIASCDLYEFSSDGVGSDGSGSDGRDGSGGGGKLRRITSYTVELNPQD